MKNGYTTQQSYLIGFVLSVVLTIIPFFVVASYDTMNKEILINIIVSCSVIQIFVHLIFFLHVGNMSNQAWSLISLIFTVFIVFILVLGSVWIMTHLHYNLMI
ncbi:cytochrome o ubiquinol oxidase subunit IV [Blochmannia endosymbiont of Camponotus sp. C-003]|uniref:cytochrome o ubiquinol oxidase subunit IV n=1 Tax=unclassified Candidatus Blochmanniella TaxID=711328 RepID=UPI002024E67F|nr:MULTISPECIES: cytochrome o ubiquinol oxidase subunit IV [unclassified Candidatus Blochmannia]URJ23564.1 cytochrome o ubiquinol oxidase subunit IV [Blochmannia endosymbiont of Camponotus sp. C-003]URJ29035.1 cytochrome o ubiquinol oxidase subunit IV [Blochmannia endosymbiont of Camponotus sp. C-046]